MHLQARVRTRIPLIPLLETGEFGRPPEPPSALVLWGDPREVSLEQKLWASCYLRIGYLLVILPLTRVVLSSAVCAHQNQPSHPPLLPRPNNNTRPSVLHSELCIKSGSKDFISGMSNRFPIPGCIWTWTWPEFAFLCHHLTASIIVLS